REMKTRKRRKKRRKREMKNHQLLKRKKIRRAIKVRKRGKRTQFKKAESLFYDLFSCARCVLSCKNINNYAYLMHKKSGFVCSVCDYCSFSVPVGKLGTA